jgi:hypothetical protein
LTNGNPVGNTREVQNIYKRTVYQYKKENTLERSISEMRLMSVQKNEDLEEDVI